MKDALVIHGREDEECRALFVISALYHCADILTDRPVRFIEVTSLAVEIAVHCYSFDTGIPTQIVPCTEHDEMHAFRDAGLFVGVALRDDTRVPRELAYGSGTPCLIVAQFPPFERMTARALANLAAAQNPRAFADLVRRQLNCHPG